MDNTERYAPPTVSLRVPGQWQSMAEFVEQLPSHCEYKNNWLRVGADPAVWLTMQAADLAFPNVFESATRRPPLLDEMDRVRDYANNVCVSCARGSNKAAQRVLRIGAALIEAGGAGVFVDNGAISHGASDWLDLEKHCTEPLAVFYAFVNIVRDAEGYSSYGMHVTGQHDGFIRCPHDATEETANETLLAVEDFLRLSAREERQWSPEELFKDERGQSFRLQPAEGPWFLHKNHPMWNPHGRWEIVPVDQEQVA